jgi:sec-independent protein translocase protein TatB
MFDISWSELLILGVVTLIFVGPKELPRFLGTLGRYAGFVRRQANEFRSVFEQAMREAEMEEIQKEVRAMSDGVKASIDDAARQADSVKAAVNAEPSIAKPAVAPPTQDAKPAEAVPQTAAEAAPAAPETTTERS